MNSEIAKPIDRSVLLKRRDRFAARAADHDFLLQRVAEDIFERLAIVQRDFARAVNVGAHHGLVSRAIRELPNVGIVVDLEPAGGLLQECDGPRVLGDEEALPFGEGDFDLAVSGLALQFVNDLPGTLVQIRRALKPDGLLLAALMGGETLKELRHAWLVAEEEVTGGASPRVLPFVDVRQLGGLAQRAGFALPVADADVVQVTYQSPLALMNELRCMAAGNVLSGRRRVPVTRGLLMRACEVYADIYGMPDGRVPATFEILTLTAWVPDESQPKPLKPGSAQVSLAKVLGSKADDGGGKDGNNKG
ncbi:MAG: methyltransferase domain-containing protein [Alphaproteobacteria bacterium]|nr:methyltransferase domain-containing protein [Alphaproteobacteria bacterium]